MYLHTLLKPEFRLDILLWRLNFFESSYQARQAINEKKVKVNQKRVAGNFFLSKGDIISFSHSFNFKNLDISEKINKNTQSDTVFSFVEVDYYSNTVVVIKNLKDLTTDDFHLLLNETYNIKKIKDYI
jgi:ribosomal protein S4